MVDDLVQFLYSLVPFLEHHFWMALCSTSSSRHASVSVCWKQHAEPPHVGHKRSTKEAFDRNVQSTDGGDAEAERTEHGEKAHSLVQIRQGLSFPSVGKASEAKARRRPTMLVIPQSCAGSDFRKGRKEKEMVEKDLEVEGGGFCLLSRMGVRHAREDGYGVITDIDGNSKQAFFGVFDGHGGVAAVDFVSEKLGQNIIAAMAEAKKLHGEENHLEIAIREGYLTTDREFLSQGVSSGACAATVLLKDGELHAANVGDCRVVLSHKGVAIALTSDHSARREDERIRIESSGGFVSCRSGVWRIQDSLAVSRAIGDINLKEWIISEPEIKKLHVTQDCEFVIIASDGLWDKVTNQEAVDVVLRHNNKSMRSCKELVEISCSRGGRDDITVMVVDLQRFIG
ncbi:probable protein phosphatase 2C 77 [Typha angustifolia]|uniref:probable protein phosphatase 2C 77 n=1 Tax=Typha angustifolia TaxID=59011 RepID=UPI003C2AC747